MTQTWAGIAWAHWRVPAEEVQRLVPAALEVDTFDGTAWVGLVPFQMEDLRLVLAGRQMPGIGSTRTFSEVNVRTYVRGPNGPGVWFHTLDASSRLAVSVARAAWALPYRVARISSSLDQHRRSWSVQRADGTTGGLGIHVGREISTDPLSQFLTARFRLYAPLGHRRLLTAPIRHRPWSLRRADMESLDAGMVHASGYTVSGSVDHLLAGDPVEVSIGLPQIVRTPDPARIAASGLPLLRGQHR